MLSSAIVCGVASSQTPEQVIGKMVETRRSTKTLVCELAVEVTTHSRWNSRLDKFEIVTPVKYSQIRTGTIDFDNGKYRWDIHGEEYSIPNRKVQPYHAAETFDGKTHRSVVYPQDGGTNVQPGRAVAADYGEFTGDLRSIGFPMEIRPLFLSHGVLPAAGQNPLYPGSFHNYNVGSNADTFTPAVNPAEPNIGIWLDTVMQSSKSSDVKVRYCFDPKRDFVLVRCMSIVKGKVQSTTSIQYNKDGHRNLLQGWVYKTQDGESPIQTFDVKVRKIQYTEGFDDSSTSLSPLPGMVVGKQKYDEPAIDGFKPTESERFRVQPDGTLEPFENKPVWWKENIRWILGSITALCCIAAGGCFLRLRKLRHSTRRGTHDVG